jgi:hypothetical protein
MPAIADYIALSDVKHSIQKQSDVSTNPTIWGTDFNLTSGTNINENSILAFIISTGTDASNLVLNIVINSSNQASYTFSGLRYLTIHEVIKASPAVLKVGTNNISFSIQSGSGVLGVSDVVLFYKRNI